MPVYADPVDGLVIQVNLLQAWTARLVESLGRAQRIIPQWWQTLI